MRILVTGIEGFVGRHLAKALKQLTANSQESVEVFGMHYPSVSIDHLNHYGYSFHPVDISDRITVEQTLNEIKPNVIIHLAGIAFVPHAMKDPFKTWNVNLFGGLFILEWIRQKSPDTRAIIVSTGEVYGAPDSPESLPYTEKTVLHPANVYAATKASLDIATQQYIITWKLNLVIARPYNHIGPWQSKNFVVSSFADQIASVKAGKREAIIKVGNLTAERDFTDVRDVVKAYILMINKVEPGVYNICSSSPVKIRAILDKLIEIAGIDVDVQIDPERLRPVDVPVITASYEKLYKQCGWHPIIELDDTLKNTFEWHLSQMID